MTHVPPVPPDRRGVATLAITASMTVSVSSYSRRSSSSFTATKPLNPLHSHKGKVVILLDRACTAAKPQGAPRVLPKGRSRHKSLGKSLGGTEARDPYMVSTERWVARGTRGHVSRD
ncbi:hypothetical protein RHGRI_007873 [Rhododendron griersonianum]|uniref:Uncharacterized protein n=1 Tax=Rhododendron griersonianum TaxID=479676 RepID=A0AAV6KZR8_9ERIC|nr:hypothetical protein RHGRI_007873 [Rhododendron griersonianum]